MSQYCFSALYQKSKVEIPFWKSHFDWIAALSLAKILRSMMAKAAKLQFFGPKEIHSIAPYFLFIFHSFKSILMHFWTFPLTKGKILMENNSPENGTALYFRSSHTTRPVSAPNRIDNYAEEINACFFPQGYKWCSTFAWAILLTFWTAYYNKVTDEKKNILMTLTFYNTFRNGRDEFQIGWKLKLKKSWIKKNLRPTFLKLSKWPQS